MKIIAPSTSISRHVPSACTLNMNSLPWLCFLRIPLSVPLPQDCGDACAASGECALLRGSKLLVFAEADQPMEQDREQDQGLSPHHMLFAKGLRWDWGIAGGVDGGCQNKTSYHTIRTDNVMRICDGVGVGVNSRHDGVGVVLHLCFQ